MTRIRFVAIAAILAVSCAIPAVSEKPQSAADRFASFPAGVSGDYAIYRDYSWKAPTWVGFLYYDDSTYGVVAVTPSTGARVKVLFSVETVDGKMILTGQNVVSKVSQDDVVTVNYLMTLLPEIWGWRSLPNRAPEKNTQFAKSRSSLLPPSVCVAAKLEDFGGDVTLTWAPEIPVFNLAAVDSAGGKPVLELARIGRIKSGGEDAFFGFSPAPEAKAGVALALPSSRKAEMRTVDGVKLALDGQWTMVADNTFFLGDAAVIIVDTLDIALLQIPADNLPLSMVRLFSLSSDQSWSYPGEVAVSGNLKSFRVTNLFYDVKTGTANRDIKECRLSADGKKCAVVSLSVSEVAYRSNKAYFDSLF